MTAVRTMVWHEQNHVGNLTRIEVKALLGEGDPKALRRARRKLQASEMVVLVWKRPGIMEEEISND